MRDNLVKSHKKFEPVGFVKRPQARRVNPEE
jgi:hypothetical protein